jgi:hypothetical protein
MPTHMQRGGSYGSFVTKVTVNGGRVTRKTAHRPDYFLRAGPESEFAIFRTSKICERHFCDDLWRVLITGVCSLQSAEALRKYFVSCDQVRRWVYRAPPLRSLHQANSSDGVEYPLHTTTPSFQHR